MINETPQMSQISQNEKMNAGIKAPPIAFLPKFEEDVKRVPSSSFYPVRRNSMGSFLPNPQIPPSHPLQTLVSEDPIVLPPIRQCVTPDCFRYDLPVTQHRDQNTQFPHSFYIQHGGNYTPDDYSIPPDEEEDYHEQTESSSNHPLGRSDLPAYYNTSGNFKEERNQHSNYFPRLERQERLERLESPEPKRRCLSLNDGYGYDSMVNKRFQFPL